MMSRIAILAVLALPFCAFAQLGASVITNIESNVKEVKRQTWQTVTYNQDGTFVDPSGQFLSSARSASLEERANIASNVLDGVNTGLTNALARVYAVTSNVPVTGYSLTFHMAPDTDRTNLTFYAAAKGTDGNYDVDWVYCNYQLALTPKVQRRYRDVAGNEAYVDGEWVAWATDNVYTNGYPGCKRVRYLRPTWARGYAVRPKPHYRIGHPGLGFTFGGCAVTVNGQPTFTGYVTNRTTRLVKYYDNGVRKTVEPLEGQ